MSISKKLMMAAGGADVTNVEDVFSMYVYEGDGTNNRSITTNIDTDTEGGLVWIKNRTQSFDNELVDSERGDKQVLRSNSTGAEYNDNNAAVLTPTGFTISGGAGVNQNGSEFISWTFRNAPKFFQCITYTGNGTAGRTISHNLNADVGMMIIKKYNSTQHWFVFHKDMSTTTPENRSLKLNTSGAVGGDQGTTFLNSTLPTSTTITLGNNDEVNSNGNSYVMYLFAHNDGDGNFGPTGDQDIIKCGSYTGNGSSDGPFENIGFEPQWVLIKRASGSAEDWFTFNGSVGIPFKNLITYTLKPNANSLEADNGVDIHVRPEGFKVTTGSSKINANGSNYIYVAIRRPTAEPENASDVFATDTWGGTVTAPPAFYSGFPVDAAFTRSWATTANNTFTTRLTQNKAYFTNVNTAGTFGSVGTLWDVQDGFWDQASSSSTYLGAMWKRAPKFFEVVTYEGNQSAGRTIEHNLKVAPEMMLVRRSTGNDNWHVYHSGADPTAPETKYLTTNSSAAAASATGSFNMWNSTAPTSTQFTLGNYISVNSNGSAHVALLFASRDGISKVGTYTGSASDQNIDCGFSSGAKFVLIKAVSNSTEWYLFTDVMGITTATNDPIIVFNDNSPRDEEYTGYSGAVSPYSGGFKVIGDNNEVNRGDGRTYIFYAVA